MEKKLKEQRKGQGMIEIDSGIIDPEVLYQRVKTTAKAKNISQEFYNTTETGNEANIYTLRRAMLRICQNMQMMKATQVIEEKPVFSNRPVIGKAIVFCKRVYRKLTRWLFQTYYLQQTTYNEATTRTIEDLIRVQEDLIFILESYIERSKTDAD